MKRHEAMKCTVAIIAAYPKPEMTEERIELYCRMLEDLDGGETMKAIERLICTNTWQPSIAEIREEVRKGTDPLLDPEVAWGEVRKAISSKGHYRVPGIDFEFSTPEIASAVDVIGWQNICNDENQAATRARFVDAYRSFHDGSVRTKQLGARATARALPGAKSMSSLLGASPADEPERRGEPSEAAKRMIQEKYGHLVQEDEDE